MTKTKTITNAATVSTDYSISSKGVLNITNASCVERDYTPKQPAPWNKYADRIISVIIPDNAVMIGEGCFTGLTNIKRMVIPASIKHIKSFAFAGCTSLITVHLLAFPVSIGDNAFAGCKALSQRSIKAIEKAGNADKASKAGKTAKVPVIVDNSVKDVTPDVKPVKINQPVSVEVTSTELTGSDKFRRDIRISDTMQILLSDIRTHLSTRNKADGSVISEDSMKAIKKQLSAAVKKYNAGSLDKHVKEIKKVIKAENMSLKTFVEENYFLYETIKITYSSKTKLYNYSFVTAVLPFNELLSLYDISFNAVKKEITPAFVSGHCKAILPLYDTKKLYDHSVFVNVYNKVKATNDDLVVDNVDDNNLLLSNNEVCRRFTAVLANLFSVEMRFENKHANQLNLNTGYIQSKSGLSATFDTAKVDEFYLAFYGCLLSIIKKEKVKIVYGGKKTDPLMLEF